MAQQMSEVFLGQALQNSLRRLESVFSCMRARLAVAMPDHAQQMIF